jgi:coenzyme F420-0:L-glutamate ligase/coenzyme F420-1:gamma-L-glutamate ligase
VSRPAHLSLAAVENLPLFRPGDDLAAVVVAALRRQDIALRDRDVLVVAQKIVSKVEGRYVDLAQVRPGGRARDLAAVVDKDPRIVEVILSESEEVVRQAPGVLIVAHRLGFVMANAGVDQSNIEHADGREQVLLLPRDPDASCARLKAALDRAFGADVGVVINDSFGRPWRNGVVGVAIGTAGLPAVVDHVGDPDLFGRRMRVTAVALADEVAAAASLLMGQTDAGFPVVHVRGLAWSAPATGASALVRPKAQDLFR